MLRQIVVVALSLSIHLSSMHSKCQSCNEGFVVEADAVAAAAAAAAGRSL